MKECTLCKETKELSEFYKDASKPTGYETSCKACHRKRSRDRYRKKMSEDPIAWKLHAMYKSAKTRAKKKGIPFNLEPEDIVYTKNCPITGGELVWDTKGQPTAHSPSLDKVVPSLGYIKGNVRVVSFWANALKSDITFEEVEAIYNYMKDNRSI